MSGHHGRAPLLAWLLGLNACASNEPSPPTIDRSGEGVTVQLLGDGFVRAFGERIPLEAFVLRMRQRMRTLSPAERQAVWVKIEIDPAAGADTAQVAGGLVEQLTIMGVPHAQFL